MVKGKERLAGPRGAFLENSRSASLEAKDAISVFQRVAPVPDCCLIAWLLIGFLQVNVARYEN